MPMVLQSLHVRFVSYFAAQCVMPHTWHAACLLSHEALVEQLTHAGYATLYSRLVVTQTCEYRVPDMVGCWPMRPLLNSSHSHYAAATWSLAIFS
jgi:hypothetical protein